MPTPERFFFAAGILIPARGIGVVGAVVTSVGASAVAVRARGGGGRRPLCAVPVFGEATGCSGQTAGAESFIVGKRWAGSFGKGRGNARSGEGRVREKWRTSVAPGPLKKKRRD